MTAFIRLVSVLLTASALTVSVNAATNPVAGKRVAVQSSKGKVMLPAGYAKMINDFPEPDPKLLEPIPISNVKSLYGRADLVKFFEIVLQSHSELMAAQDEFNRVGENSTHSPEFFEAAKKLDDEWKKVTGRFLDADFRDPEIKAVVNRRVEINILASHVLEYLIKHQKTLMGEGEKNPEINQLDVMAFLEKRNKAQEGVKKSNTEILKAVRALKKKYSL
ncbi:hypothetical protein [Neisseria sicca]